jgi:hypothetical protein
MKTTNIAASLLIIALLVISESAIIVHAYDFGDTAAINSAGTMFLLMI